MVDEQSNEVLLGVKFLDVSNINVRLPCSFDEIYLFLLAPIQYVVWKDHKPGWLDKSLVIR